ncbi:MAG TPA: mechanosensitive ion channel domain-containing protein, partial [Nitrospiraceae bacterium]
MSTSLASQLLDRMIAWVSTSGLRIILIVVIMVIAFRLIRGAMRKLETLLKGTLPTPAQVKRAETLSHVVRDVGRMAIMAVSALMILSELGLNLGPLLAAAGIGGLAVGFGAQNIVKDVLSGFFILLEDSIGVGDVVEIAGVGGLVEEVRLRTIRLRDLSG